MALQVIDMSRGNNMSEKNRVSFTKSGGTFSASFIRTHKLQDHQSFRIYKDDEKPYRITFEILYEKNAPNSTHISGVWKGATRVFVLYPIKKHFPTIQKLLDVEFCKHTNTFDLHELPHSKNFFYCDIVPTFEHTREWEDKNSIPNDASGIYRYLNQEDSVVYIGMGNIKLRTGATDRKDWNVKKIQFSIIEDFSDNKKITREFESFHMEAHKKTNAGSLPMYNLMNGVKV